MHRSLSLLLILFLTLGQIELSQFQPDLALHLLYAASASYCKSETINDFSCPPCKNITRHKLYNMTISKTIQNQPQKVIYLFDEIQKEFVISYEGTHNPFQIEHQILNSYGMTYPLKDIANAIVGSYFMEGYIDNLFRISLRQNLKSVQSEYGTGIKFIFTGHSLGGAFAALAAFDAVSQNWIERSVKDDGVITNPKVYTFGQPRLGNHPLAQAIDLALKGSYFRVTHQRDMIPHLPPCVPSFQSKNDIIREACVQGTGTFAMFYPYHSGTEIFFNEANTEFQVCNPGVEDANCSDQFNVYSIDDHFYYMGVLDNCPGDGDQ